MGSEGLPALGGWVREGGALPVHHPGGTSTLSR